ncbi:hypothetical protein [Streptomyces sp. NPDC088730]|uniref:hypothetical protein n=1 Tax=Streptomyces sp. NPDC088730 TaxID=3365877 RepID=UPI0038061E71
MAATLATYTAVLLPTPLWIRAHLAPATTVTVPFTHDRTANHLLGSVSHVDIGRPGTWTVAEQALDATGHPARSPPPAYAGCDSVKDRVDALADAGYGHGQKSGYGYEKNTPLTAYSQVRGVFAGGA